MTALRISSLFLAIALSRAANLRQSQNAGALIEGDARLSADNIYTTSKYGNCQPQVLTSGANTKAKAIEKCENNADCTAVYHVNGGWDTRGCNVWYQAQGLPGSSCIPGIDNSCNTDQGGTTYFKEAPPPVDCQGSWTDYDSADVTCGTGAQYRTYEIAQDAENGGTACDYLNGATESRAWNTEVACPVDCQGSWTDYGSTSVTCGTGAQYRTYEIAQDAENGGTACDYLNGATESRAWDTGVACQQGGASGDPHFHGFDGSLYDFQGSPGSVFNIITDGAFQLNARFVESPSDGKTYMGVLGLRVGPNRIIVTPDIVLVNDAAVAKGDHVSLKAGKENTHVGLLIFDQDRVRVKAAAFQVDVKVQQQAGFMYLDIDVAANSDYLVNPHGILGQTAEYLRSNSEPHPVRVSHKNLNAEGFLAGVADDYMVADGILGTKFTFNRYGSKDSTMKSTPRRRFAFGRALYENQV